MNDERFTSENLGQYADRLARDGDDLECARFRQMERSWRNTEQALQAAQDENTRLQRQIDEARKSLSVAA